MADSFVVVILTARPAVPSHPHQSSSLAIRLILIGHIDCMSADVIANHRRVARVVSMVSMVSMVSVVIMTAFTHQDEEFYTHR